jgi:hypothetical protein
MEDFHTTERDRELFHKKIDRVRSKDREIEEFRIAKRGRGIETQGETEDFHTTEQKEIEDFHTAEI